MNQQREQVLIGESRVFLEVLEHVFPGRTVKPTGIDRWRAAALARNLSPPAFITFHHDGTAPLSNSIAQR